MYFYRFAENDFLHVAVKNGDLATVISLIEQANNFDYINTLDSVYKISVLSLACITKNADLVKELLKRGARVDVGNLQLRRCAFDEASLHSELIPLMLLPTKNTVDHYESIHNQSDDIKGYIALLAFSLADFYLEKNNLQEQEFVAIGAKNQSPIHIKKDISKENLTEKYYQIAIKISKTISDSTIIAPLQWRKAKHLYLKGKSSKAFKNWQTSLKRYEKQVSFLQILAHIDMMQISFNPNAELQPLLIFIQSLVSLLQKDMVKEIFLQFVGIVIKETNIQELKSLNNVFIVLINLNMFHNQKSIENYLKATLSILSKKIDEGLNYSNALLLNHEIHTSSDMMLAALEKYRIYLQKSGYRPWSNNLADYVNKLCIHLTDKSLKNATLIAQYEKLTNNLLLIKDVDALQTLAINLHNIAYSHYYNGFTVNFNSEVAQKVFFLSIKCFHQLIQLEFNKSSNFEIMSLDINSNLKLKLITLSEAKFTYYLQRDKKINQDTKDKITKLLTEQFIEEIDFYITLYNLYKGMLTVKNEISLLFFYEPICLLKNQEKMSLEISLLALELVVKNKIEDFIHSSLGGFALRATNLIPKRIFNDEYCRKTLTMVTLAVDYLLTLPFKKTDKALEHSMNELIEIFVSFFKEINSEEDVLNCYILRLKTAHCFRNTKQIATSSALIRKSIFILNENLLPNNTSKFKYLIMNTWNLFQDRFQFDQLILLMQFFNIEREPDEVITFTEALNKVVEYRDKIIMSKEQALEAYDILLRAVNQLSTQISSYHYNLIEKLLDLTAYLVQPYSQDKYSNCLNKLADKKWKMSNISAVKDEVMNSYLLQFEAIDIFKEANNIEQVIKLIREIYKDVGEEIQNLIKKESFLEATDLVRQMLVSCKNIPELKDLTSLYQDLKMQVHIGLAERYLKKEKFLKASDQYSIAIKSFNRVQDQNHKLILSKKLDIIQTELKKNIYSPNKDCNQALSKPLEIERDFAKEIIPSSQNKKKNKKKSHKKQPETSKSETIKSTTSHVLSRDMLIGSPLHGGYFLKEENCSLYPVLDMQSKDVQLIRAHNPIRFKIFKCNLLAGKITTAHGHNGIKYCGTFWEIKVHGPDRLKAEHLKMEGKNYLLFNKRIKK